MRAGLLDGQDTARAIREELKIVVAQTIRNKKVVPQLAAVLVGDDTASDAYVSMKGKACKWIGIESRVFRLSKESSQEEVEGLIDQLNADATISGVLIQHPVPKHLDEIAILSRLVAEKDVDGISRNSLGSLITGQKAFKSCTPLGIIELLKRYKVPFEGKHAVVVGRSIILGKPVAHLLLDLNCTVTICHSRTLDLGSFTRQADILVAAVGRPELITGDMIKRGAVVVDAGYNRVAGRTGDVGDVEFESASRVASLITPVPGGVGPMTIAMLLKNTVEAANQFGFGVPVNE